MRIFRLILTIISAVICGLALAAAAPSVTEFIWGLIQNYFVPGGAREKYRFADSPVTKVPVGLFGVIVGAGLGNLIASIFGRMGDKWDRMEAGDKVTLFLGIFAGIIFTVPFMILFSQLGPYGPVITVALLVGSSALAIYALRSMEDTLPWQRGKKSKRRKGIKILDTNVIIDGRIYDVARTGFLEGQIYVPAFVLEELQHIADSPDALRRQRGRRGLDVLRHMQSDFPLEVGIHDKLAGESDEEVDSRLVRLAKSLGADIVTNDFNLNRVAALHEVTVLNLNDLALAMKPNVLPGENLTVTLIREGNQIGQGIAYLDDGTMVVVDRGKNHLNETLEVAVTQVIQTERGKMIFAEVPDEEPIDDPNQLRRKNRYPK